MIDCFNFEVEAIFNNRALTYASRWLIFIVDTLYINIQSHNNGGKSENGCEWHGQQGYQNDWQNCSYHWGKHWNGSCHCNRYGQTRSESPHDQSQHGEGKWRKGNSWVLFLYHHNLEKKRFIDCFHFFSLCWYTLQGLWYLSCPARSAMSLNSCDIKETSTFSIWPDWPWVEPNTYRSISRNALPRHNLAENLRRYHPPNVAFWRREWCQIGSIFLVSFSSLKISLT